jgi:hypothetical protein
MLQSLSCSLLRAVWSQPSMGTATVAHIVRLPTHLLTLWHQVHPSQHGPLDSVPQEPIATSTNAICYFYCDYFMMHRLISIFLPERRIETCFVLFSDGLKPILPFVQNFSLIICIFSEIIIS